MRVFYTISLYIYYSMVRLAGLFSFKARSWVQNRKNWTAPFTRIQPGSKTIWIHAASAGEFEQAIPVIEQLRNSGNDLKVAVSFYSASGYDLYKNTDYADVYFHFPTDYPTNAALLVSGLNPVIALFIRNEIWWNTLQALHKKNIPILLMNAVHRKRSGIYGWYLKKCYPYFSKIFYSNVTGNTLLERVVANTSVNYTNAFIENYIRDSFVLILGSCYEKEVSLAAAFYQKQRIPFPSLKIIFCPHEWTENTITSYQKYFEDTIGLYSQNSSGSRLLLIDQPGILKYLYRFANAAIIGGGFGKGIHNAAEAGVYGIPVLIGPKYQQFQEVSAMVKQELITVIQNETDTIQTLERIMNEPVYRTAIKEKWKHYFNLTGNTSIIIWKAIEKYISS